MNESPKVQVYTLDSSKDSKGLKYARELLHGFEVHVQQVATLNVWQRKELQRNMRGNPVYPLFVIGEEYIGGVRKLEEYVRDRSQEWRVMKREVESEELEWCGQMENERREVDFQVVPKSQSIIFENLEREFQEEIQRVANENRMVDLTWGEVKPMQGEMKKNGSLDDHPLNEEDKSCYEFPDAKPYGLNHQPNPIDFVIRTFYNLKRTLGYLKNNHVYMNDTFFERMVNNVENVTRMCSSQLGLIQDHESSNPQVKKTYGGGSKNVNQGHELDTEVTFTFPIIQTNWYWRPQKRFIRLELEQMVRLDPENLSIREIIPYSSIHSISIKKDGEFSIKYNVQCSGSMDTYEEVNYSTISEILAGQIGEAIQNIENMRHHRIAMTYFS